MTPVVVILVGVAVFVGAVYLARKAGPGPSSGAGFRGNSEFLCDGCKYDHVDLCSRPERPNATSCDDFKSR